MLVWDLEIPREAVGAVVAVTDGYEGKLMLRSVAKPAAARNGRPVAGRWQAWVMPAFEDEVVALFRELRERFTVNVVAGPRPFAAADLAAGMPLRLDAP
jgi:hypothetical protein